MLEGALRHGHGLINVEGLGQVLESSPTVGGNCAFQVRMGSHDNDRKLRNALMQRGQQLQAIDAGHANVAENNVWLVLLQPLQ